MTTTNPLREALNTTWHRPAVWAFTAIVLAHIAEHAVQSVQIYILGWEAPDSRGLFGQWFPWLVTSESMHYFYAIVTLGGLALLLPGFVGMARFFWTAALLTQFWHHLEHGVLLVQRVTESPWFGEPVPTSLVQLVVTRVELHLFYNTVVFVPMLIAIAYHLFPSEVERLQSRCDCAWRGVMRLAPR